MSGAPTPQSPPGWRVVTVFVLGALGIAFAAIFVRLALPAPPVVTAFYRMLFALPVLALIVAIQRPRMRTARLAWAGLAGALFGTDLALWHIAVVETSAATATLLVNTTPIPVGLWAAWALSERPGWRFVAGVAIGLGGTAVLLGVDRTEPGHLRGDLLALCAALFYAGYLILMKSLRRDMDASAGIFAATVGAIGVTGLYALLRGDPFTGFPAHSWAAFGGAALVSHVGGVLGIAWGLRWLRATFASLTLLVQPVGTALLAWWLLGEALSPAQAAGGVAVLCGILLASRSAFDPAADDTSELRPRERVP